MFPATATISIRASPGKAKNTDCSTGRRSRREEGGIDFIHCREILLIFQVVVDFDNIRYLMVDPDFQEPLFHGYLGIRH